MQDEFAWRRCDSPCGIAHRGNVQTYNDVLASLDGFANSFSGGCELVNIDIAGQEGSCTPNGLIDLFDILAVLNAFQGDDNCCE